MANGTWLEALKVSKELFQLWQKQKSKDESLVHWCLITNKISKEQYFEWAQENYGLAKISSEFFKQSPNRKLWAQIQSVANWSKDFVPIIEWDGVVFVACIEPRHDVKWSFRVQYVLADAVDLENYWSALHTAETSPTAEALVASQAFDAPQAGLASAATNKPKLAFKLPPLPDQKSQNTVEATVTQLINPTQTKASDAPAGLKINDLAPEDLKLSDDAPVGLKLNDAAPAGLNMNDLAPEGLKLNDRASAGLNMNDLAPAGLKINQVAPADLNLDQSSPVIQFRQQTISVDYSRFLHEIENEFLCGMILRIENEHVAPVEWGSQFKPVAEKSKSPFTLSQPSAFRVAYRTKLPYLGHVVDTPMNKDFFSNWGFQAPPKQILIQPVQSSGRVHHLLLLIADPEKKNQTLLSAAEKLAEEWLKNFSPSQAA